MRCKHSHTKNCEKLADISIEITKIIDKYRVVDWFKSRGIQNKIKNEMEDYIYEQDIGALIDFDSMDRIMEEVIKTAKYTKKIR